MGCVTGARVDLEEGQVPARLVGSERRVEAGPMGAVQQPQLHEQSEVGRLCGPLRRRGWHRALLNVLELGAAPGGEREGMLRPAEHHRGEGTAAIILVPQLD